MGEVGYGDGWEMESSLFEIEPVRVDCCGGPDGNFRCVQEIFILFLAALCSAAAAVKWYRKWQEVRKAEEGEEEKR